ncbi:MAG TPA: DoxX family membrane protein [Ktedonobacteraceae bacterium]|nr:DoxX family membrane protein [Ktedonobacteraceae bacterium]
MRKLLQRVADVRKDIVRVIVGILFILASTMHFTSDVELKIIPAFLPWRPAALYITGVFELLGGIGLLIPRFKRPAAWGLVALLIAIFPANIYQAVMNIQLGGFLNTRLYQWGRLPFQGVFIWLVLWSTGHRKKAA